MKKVIVLLFFTGIILSALSAQKTKRYTIMPGENIIEVVSQSELYEYPQFEKGAVYFKDGAKSSVRLNYHIVYEEIHFIDPKGDTLSVINPAEISSIVIGKDQFYYEGKRYVKLDTVIGEVKLAAAKFFTAVKKQKVGAYGNTTDGAAESINSYVTLNNAKLELTPQSVTTIAQQNVLFLGNRFNLFLPVTKKNIFLVYNKKESQLKQYLQKANLDYSSRQDIINLILFMNTQ